MNRVICLLTLLVGLKSYGQDFRVTPLFEETSFVIGRYIPFKVYGNNKKQAVRSISIVEGECEGAIDQFRGSIVHIYCSKAGEVSFRVEASSGDVLLTNTFPVRDVSIIDIVPDPTDDPEVVTYNGKDLYESNCLECHRGLPLSRPQTANNVRSALSRDPMKSRGLDLIFNNDDEKLGALIQYINEEL